MRTIPTVRECMIASPYTIGEDIPLSQATHRMHEFGIRHLPVLKAGKLVGILTDRDIKLALSVHPLATDLRVADIMTEDVYVVTPETPLDEATETMFRNKLGCTVVRDDSGRTIGVLTTVDALKVLTALLRGVPVNSYSNAARAPYSEALKSA